MTTRRSEASLPAWNRVVEPHPDIIEGQLSMDTYAVNLSKVIQGDVRVRPVYRDARTFFEATYLTTELRRILSDVMDVLAGKSGNRVLQLRTPFGGGKTHTLLALYHLAHSRHLLNTLQDLANISDPGPVRIAVISGLDMGAADTHSQRRTIWGELAWQLGREEGYSLVAEQDRQGIAPGGDVLARLIGDTSTLLLLDEVLVYVENAMGVAIGESNLGRQTLTFLQRLMEVVAASPRSVIVYSLQASEQEAGGNQALLSTLGKLVQRLNAIREPVSGDEVLSVVQRRLFANIGNVADHQQVAQAYADNYRTLLLAGSTPLQEAQQRSEQLYERILLSYPFHPSLLDLMRERWSGLPSYQRTRGALQFLATAVRVLWAENVQTQPLLGPGDILLKDGEVRTTFLAQVGETTQYDAVLQADLIGPTAGAQTVDMLMVKESPQLQVYLPGTRIATAALLYSFGGSSHIERGVYENELLSSCLAPGLDRNILQTALHDLNEKLLYLHRRDNRYRFETQPNLNKMIIDENQRRSEEEVETRLRSEFSKAIGNERGAVVWPKDTHEVRDRLAEFQIVYLSPMWLDTYSDGEQQNQGMRLFIENCGNGPRRYRNGLAIAIPDPRMVDAAQNAVRLILTLELLQSQSTQRQLTAQQSAELMERRHNAEKELKGAISQMYPVVYTPQYREQDEPLYSLDALTVQSYSQAPQLHVRIKEALHNRVVWDSVQPSKLATLTRLNELEPLEQQFYPVEALIACFFSYYNWTHIWNEGILRKGIAIGVKNRTFAYVANARKDERNNLILRGPASTVTHFGKDIPMQEIDMGEGAYILSSAYAQQLLAPAPPKVESIGDNPPQQPSTPANTPPTSSGQTAGTEKPTSTTLEPPVRPVAPGREGQKYRLRLQTNDLFELFKSLEKLAEHSSTIDMTFLATAKKEQTFLLTTLHNLIVEPMLEASNDIVVREEQVEE